MVLTAKVDFKKLIIILAAAAALILALLLLVGGKEETAQTAAPAACSKDGGVKFLTDFGGDVTPPRWNPARSKSRETTQKYTAATIRCSRVRGMT